MPNTIIDPVDVLPGNTQVITANIKDTDGAPVTSVTGTFALDHVSGTISFSRISGDGHDGTWRGSWVMPNDTYCLNFVVTIYVTSNSGTSNNAISLQ